MGLEPTIRNPRLRILAARLPDLPSKGPQTAPTTTTTVCRTLRSRHDHTVCRPLLFLEEGAASSPCHSPPDWAVGCQAIDEEAAQQLLSLALNTAHELPHIRFLLRDSGSASFLVVSTHAGRSASIPKFHKDHLWTKLSATIKGGFAFLLFPLVCIRVCA